MLQPIDGHYFYAYSVRILFFGQHCFCFKDVRTDTMCENNDHLFGRGLVGQEEILHEQACYLGYTL